jgi:hypothetical protein
VTFFRALRRLPPFETGLLVLAIAVLTGLGLVRGERSESDVPLLDSFSSFDAASGGYRAFYTVLEREGIRVERFERQPAFLDSRTDTLVYAEPYTYDPRQVVPSRGDVAALEAWVRSGGRLLYIGYDDAAAKAGLLHLPATTATEPRAARRRRPYVAPELAAAGVARIVSRETRRWKRARDTTVLLADARGPLVLRYRYGRGRVTTLVDESLFRNDALAAGDRARLAFALARPGRAAGEVAFDELVHGYAVPGRWWTLVPRGFAIALVVALVAIAIALAGAAIRFGPPVVPVDRRDRSSADFIDALSSLLERGHAERKALADAAVSTSRALARSFGLGDAASTAEIAERLPSPASRDAYRTLVAFADGDLAKPSDFVRGLALAQALRKEYAAHGRPRN